MSRPGGPGRWPTEPAPASGRPAGGWTSLFLAQLLVALAVAWPGLAAPLLWDDLHLVRPYTAAELASTWSGPWDPDRVETPGFRPLTTLFNHARAVAFGESTPPHRVLVLALFALHATLLGRLAAALFATPPPVALIAGALAMASVANAANYLWVADGVHLLAAGLVVAALLGAVAYQRGGSAWSLVGSLAALAAALLTRPEANAAVPLLALAVAAAGGRPRRGMVPFAGAVGAVLAAYWAWQVAVVPDLAPVGLFPREYGWALYEGALGLTNPAHAVRWPAQGALALAAASGLALTALLAAGGQQRAVAFWTAAALAAALPCLAAARSNLLVLPIGFWSLALASVLGAAAARPGRRRGLAGLALAALLVPGLIAAWTLGAEHRRENLEWLCADAVALNGDLRAATVPPARRQAVLRRLEELGVGDGDEARARLGALAADPRLFVPTASLLVDPGGKVTPCGEAIAALGP